MKRQDSCAREMPRTERSAVRGRDFMVPLFYRSVRKADELSDALESRGYHLKRRYYYYSQNPALRDYIAGGVFLGLAILILFPPV